ncbi:carbohydrate-binding protein, partial [Actinacidiphila rubida]
PATHGVTVNAAGGYTASYPSTGGWGANGMWNVAFVDVPLVAGDNVVTLSKGTAFAELDCVFLAGEAPAR